MDKSNCKYCDIICYRSKLWDFYPRRTDSWTLFPENEFSDVVYQWKSADSTLNRVLTDLGNTTLFLAALCRGRLHTLSDDLIVKIHVYPCSKNQYWFQMEVIDNGRCVMESKDPLFIEVDGTTGIRLDFERGEIFNNLNPPTSDEVWQTVSVDSYLDSRRLQKIDVYDKSMPMTFSSDSVRPDIWKFGHLLVAMILKEDKRYSQPGRRIICNIKYSVVHTKPFDILTINVGIIGKNRRGSEVITMVDQRFDANCEYLIQYDSVHRRFVINKAELVEKLRNGEIGLKALNTPRELEPCFDVRVRSSHIDQRIALAQKLMDESLDVGISKMRLESGMGYMVIANK